MEIQPITPQPYSRNAMFDTLALSERLRANGYTEQQAKVQAQVWNEIIDHNLVTKNDLKQTEAKLQQGIEELRADMNIRFKEIDGRFKELEYKMTIKLGSIVMIGLGAMVAIQKLL